MLSIQALSTGSSGNCYLLRWQTNSQQYNALIDAGLPIRKLAVLLEENGVTLGDIHYIFITHEHSDHVENLKQLLKHTTAKLFLTAGTWFALSNKSNIEVDQRLKFVTATQQHMCNEMQVDIHKVPHDGRETVCYSFTFAAKKIAVVTDLGSITAEIHTLIESLDILFLEFNYDEEMLKNSQYPAFLKRRISGTQGHLSNHQANQCLAQCQRKPNVLVGVHLSEKNNSVELVRAMMTALGYTFVNNLQQIELGQTSQSYYCSVLPHGHASEMLSL